MLAVDGPEKSAHFPEGNPKPSWGQVALKGARPAGGRAKRPPSSQASPWYHGVSGPWQQVLGSSLLRNEPPSLGHKCHQDTVLVLKELGRHGPKELRSGVKEVTKTSIEVPPREIGGVRRDLLGEVTS